MCAGDICLSPKRQRNHSPKNEKNKEVVKATCGSGCCVQTLNDGKCLNATKLQQTVDQVMPLTFPISSIPSLAMISLSIPTNYEKNVDGFLFASNPKGDRTFLTTMPFECSHELDKNSLQALHHDEWEIKKNIFINLKAD